MSKSMTTDEVLNRLTDIINFAVDRDEWKEQHNNIERTTDYEIVINKLSVLHSDIYHGFSSR